MMQLQICRAKEVEHQLNQQEFSAVLSIEHPGAQDGNGRAPRLNELGYNIPQLTLTFWDVEETGRPDFPSIEIIKQAFEFLDTHQDENILIHCNAGKARSVGIALGWLAGKTNIENAIQYTKEIRPQAAPNIAIIKLADELLELGGQLIQTVLDDPDFTRNRELANQRRREQASQGVWNLNPEQNRPGPLTP